MNVTRYLPADVLKPFVKAFMIIESETGCTNMLLPDTALVLAFRFKGHTRDAAGSADAGSLPSAVLTGLRRSARLLAYGASTANVLVIFQEGGAAAFFRQPLHELFDCSTPLSGLIRRQQIEDAEEQIAAAPDNRQRIIIAERFLITQLIGIRPDGLVQNALGSIKAAAGNISIKALAGSLYISQDAFEKRFRRVTGATPKQMARIVRLRSLISRYRPGQSLTGAAYEAGYFDQAHFIRDFRLFTGQAPRPFFQSAVYW